MKKKYSIELKKGDTIQLNSRSLGMKINFILQRIERKYMYGKYLIRFFTVDGYIIAFKKQDSFTNGKTMLIEKLGLIQTKHYLQPSN